MSRRGGGDARVGAALLIGLLVAAGPAATAFADAAIDAEVGEAARIVDGALYVTARDGIVARGADALPDLQRLATDAADWRERAVAAACAGWIEHADRYAAFALTELRTTASGQSRYVYTGAGFDAALLPLLIERLVWTEAAAARRAALVFLIGKLRDASSTEALGWAVQRDDSRAVRRASVAALQEAPDGRATELLVDALTVEPAEVRAAAAAALGWRKDLAAVPPLLTALSRDDDPTCRARAAQSLGWLGDPSADLALEIALTRDPSADVRGQAALALGKLATDRARTALTAAAAHDPDPEVARLATVALERF